MPLSAPSLDDRRYWALVAELLRRIPVYSPEWTDVPESDPGVTLLELLAFLGEEGLWRRSDGKSKEGVLPGRPISGEHLAVMQCSPRMRKREYLAPGIYLEEIPGGLRAIAGVTTSTTGFAGLGTCSLRIAIVARPRKKRCPVAIIIGAVPLAVIVGIMLWRLRAGAPGSKGAEQLTSDSPPTQD